MPPTASSRSPSRSSPSTSGARRRTRPSARRSSTPPLVGTGPVPGRRVADRPVHPPPAQPELLGRPGLRRTRSTSSSTRPRTRWSRRSRRASSTTRTGSTPSSSSRSKTEPNIATVAGSANGWTQLAFNGYGAEHRQDHPQRRALDEGAPRPGVPRRPGLRGRPPGAGRSRPRRLRRRRHDDRPAGPDQVARRADHPADVRHRAGQAEARRGRLPARRRRDTASTRKASRSTCGCSCPTRTTTIRRRRSSSRPGTDELGVKVTTQVFSSATLTEMIYPPEGGEGYTADYDIELWGWSGGIDPNGLLADLQVRRHRQLVRQPVLQPGIRQDVRRPAGGRDGRGTQDDPRRDAEPDLRRGRLRHPLLRREPRRLSDRPVRRVGRTSPEVGDAVLHVQHAPVHEAHRCDAWPTPEPSVAPASAGPSGADVAVAPVGRPDGPVDSGAASSTTPLLARPRSPSWRSWPSGSRTAADAAKAAGGAEDDE